MKVIITLMTAFVRSFINFTTAVTATAKKIKFLLQTRCSRLLMFVLLLVSAGMNNAKAQSITFTGATTDFTTPGISALAAGTGDVTYYASTDGTFMYFGAFRTNSQTWGSTDHFTVYIDADPRSSIAGAGNGSIVGLAWDNQTPTLATRADYRIAIRTDGSTGSGLGSSFYSSNNTTTNTANWTTGGANAKGYTQYVSNASNGGIEIRVPLSDFGNPASTYISMFSSFSGGGGGFFAPATGTFTGNTLSGYLRNLGVYKATGNLTAGAVTTPITDATVLSTAGDFGDITLSGATTFTLVGNTSYSGSLTIGSGTTNSTRIALSTFSLFAGGSSGISGTTAGRLIVNGSSGAVFTTGTGGTFSFLGAGAISGANVATTPLFPTSSTVTLGGAVDFGTVGLAASQSGIAGVLQINANGSVITNAPTYGASSSLIYNTGSTYTAGTEWSTGSASAKGVPQIVTIQNNTQLNFGSSGAYRQANGLVTIGSGSSLTLSSATNGDLRIAAGLTNNNAGTGVGINTNGRAIQSMGTGIYTKAGTDNLDYLIIGSANTLTLASGTNLNLTNTLAVGALQFNAVGSIFMGGTNTVTLAAGTSVGGSTAGSIGGSSPTTSILSLAGTTTWNPGGVITVSTNVGIQVNLGLTISTAGRLSAGYLQINPGGFIGGSNAVVYPASSTLVYNHSSGVYGVNALEWPATTGPVNVTVNANGTSTGISFANNNISARTLTGILTLNHDLDLSGSGPAALTTLNTIANATATVKGVGNYTQSLTGSFTTANVGGINGTLTTLGTTTFQTNNNFTFNSATASQVTGALLPATINNLTINNPTALTGTTISTNTLVISGVTTLTAGALVLPTAANNLVTFTGNISTPTGGGTITGSTTSNIVTSGTVAGTGSGIAFTTGGQNLGNWTCNAVFGASTPTGLNSALSINGTFSFPSGTPDFYTTASGSITFVSGSTFTQNGTSGSRILGSGTCTVQSGSNMIIGSTTGLASTGANGAIQTTTRTFSGAANFTFNNATTAQAIGDALDGAGGTGKTGPISGNVVINNSTGTGVTLNAGTTITINTPGTFNIGVTGTSSAILTAPALSIINGTGTINMFGNGATSGSTLTTANASGVNGTFATTATNLTNGANNNTIFRFNGTALGQVTGTLMPTIVGGLVTANATGGSAALTPAVLLTNSTVVNGTLGLTAGHLSINGNTLTLNGTISVTAANTLVGTATSNLIIGGTGVMGNALAGATNPFNNFTLNRVGGTMTLTVGITVNGTFSLLEGNLGTAFTTTLNGPITITNGTFSSAGTGQLVIGGSGTITGSLTTLSATLPFTAISMNRASTTLTLGSNVTVSNLSGLSLTAGNIALGNFNLTSTNSAGQLGSGSASSMIVATGSGQAFNTIPTTGFIAQTYPIGDGTNYTPVILTFSANTVGGTVGVKTTASASGNINTGSTPSVYISRFWTFSNTSLTNYTYSGTFRYISPGDVQLAANEANLKLSRWTGSAWSEFAGSSVASPVLSSGSLTQATGPLSNEFTGRTNVAAINYVWNGTTDDWNTGTNWLPNGVPAALDNVTIDGTSAVLCSINSSSYSVNNFTLNGTGTFAMVSGTSLTINGSVTYGGTATASLDCASTINIASTSPQTVPALNFGNLNLTGGDRTLAALGSIGICGTFTPGAGTFTVTGSTVDFNGAGAQTIPAATYNNLTSSSNGARTLAGSGLIKVAGIFTPGTNAYTVTGSTVDFTNAASQTIPAFNYNNITNTGGGPRVLANTGTVAVAGAFTPGAGAYTITGSTVDYNGTTGITLSTFTYNNLTISGNKGAGTVSFGSGTITIGGILSYTATNATQAPGSGTVVFNAAGSQTIPALNYFNLTTSGGARTLAATGTINIAGALFTPGTGPFTVAGSTVNYSNGTGLTIPALTPVATNNYHNLTISGAGTFPQAGTLSIGGDYNQSAGIYTVTNGATAYNLDVAGNFIMTNGTFNVLTSTTATVSSTVTVTGNTTTSGTASIVLESVSNTNANGIGVFQTTDFTTTSTSTSIIEVGATGTYTNNEFRIKGNLNKSGTGTFNIQSTSNLAGGIVFNKAGTQTFSYAGTASGFISYYVNNGSTLQITTSLALGSGNNPYSNFTVNTGGILDMGASSVISGGSATVIAANTGFTLSSGSTLITANATGVTGSVTTLIKSFSSAANYEFQGAATGTFTTTPTALTVNNLTINRVAGVTMSQNFTSNGTLVLTNGTLTTNANTMFAAGSVTRTNGWVNGNLQRAVAGGVSTVNYFIGDATIYAPVTVTFAAGTGAGNLTASTTLAGAPPAAGFPTTGSGISQTKYINRFWRMTNNSVTTPSYSIGFNYNGTDITGGASQTALIIGKLSGAVWSNPGVTSSGSLAVTSATGQTTFSDFYLGESGCVTPSLATSQVNITCAVPTGSATVTPTGGTSPYTYLWNDGAAQTTQTATGLAAGTYTVTVTATGGCTVTTSVTITSNTTAPIVSAGSPFTKTCTSNTSGAAIGEADDVTASYAWSPPAGLSSTSVSNPIANPTTTTTYTVTKTTTANGCTSTASVEVTVNTTAPAAGITNNTGVTVLSCANPTISLTATGGGTYLWSSGATVANANQSYNTAGAYTVTVTDAVNGCTASTSITITGSVPGPNGDYQSFQTGNWNDPATWNVWNGCSWVAAGAAPSSADNVITILTGHVVTVTASVTIDQTIVNAGGTLQMNSGVILNNGVGNDLTVNGTIICKTNVVSGAGFFALNADATIKCGNASGIDGSITTLRSLSTSANYVFNGTGNQNTGGMPSTVKTFTCANTGSSGNNLVNLWQSQVNLTSPVNSLVLESGFLTVQTLGFKLPANGQIVSTGGDFDAPYYGGYTDCSNGGTVTVTGNVSFKEVDLYNNTNIAFSSGSKIYQTLALQTNAGSVLSPPQYMVGSQLFYSPGGTYVRGAEWSATSGNGYPQGVRVALTTLMLENGTPMVAVAMADQLALTSGILDMAGMQASLSIGTLNGGNLILSNLAGGNCIVNGGLWSCSGFTANGRKVTFQNSGTAIIQGINTGTTFYDLDINKVSGAITMNNNITVNGTLNLNDGIVTTGSNQVNISSTGSVARVNGWVNGNLNKYVATGAGITRLFEIGTASSYLPQSVTFTNVSTGGMLNASTASGDHANIGTSPIDALKSINRTWSFTNTGIDFASGSNTAAVTLNWLVADEDAGLTYPSLKVAKFDAPSTWTSIAVASQSGTSITTTSSINSFSDFQVGESGCIIPSLSTSQTNISCVPNNPTGSATVTATGGSSPYTYLWNDGAAQTTATATGLAAGTYTVTVTATGGCTISTSVTITGNTTAPLVSAIASLATICEGSSTTLTASGADTYSWMPGNLTGTTVSVSPVTSTTYTVTGTAANGCSAAATASIAVNSIFTASGSQTNVACKGNNTGTITLAVTGGLNVSYLWNDGSTIASRTNLFAGTYTVTISDNCKTQVLSFTVTEPAAALAATATGTNVNCFGNATGTATVTATGGTTAYSYSWNTTPVQTTATATGLAAGTYTVTVTDANGCTTTASYTVTQPATPAAPTASVTQPTCATATGTITVTSTTSGLTFSLDGGTYAAYPSGGYTVAAGVHTLTAQNTAGCISSVTNITVDAQSATPAAPTASVIQPTCATATGTITVTSTTSGLTFSLDGGTYAAYPSGGYTVAAGVHTLTAQNAADCISSVTNITVDAQPATPAQPTTGTVTQPTCSVATGSFTITNYIASYTYTFSPTGPTVDGSGVVTAAAGTYTITATLGACSSIASSSVTVNAQPATPAQPTTGTVTQPTCLVATGSFTITNYIASYTYTFSPSGPTVDGSGLVTAAVGTYTITATLGACSSIASTSVTVNAQPATPAQPTTGTITQPTCSVATGSFTITNYNAAYTYTFSPVGPTVDGSGVVTAAAGTYTITATLGACSSIASASVVINTQPTTVVITVTLTGGGTVTPSGNTTVTCGANQTFTFTPNSGSLLASVIVDGVSNPAAVSSGTYTFTNVTTSHTLVVNFTSQTIVESDPALVDVDITSTAGAPINANQIIYSSVNKLNLSILNFSLATAVPNGTIKVKIDLGDKLTLDNPTGFATTLPPAFTWTVATVAGHQIVTGDQVAELPFDYNEVATLDIKATAAGQSLATGDILITNHNNASVFLVDVILGNNHSELTYTVLSNFTAVVQTATNVSCFGGNNGSITILATGGATPYSYSIDGGTTYQSSPVFNNLIAGTYSIIAKDNLGQMVTVSYTVTQPAAALTATATGTNVNCFGNATGTATVTATGGTTAYSYSWNTTPVQTTATATGLAAGTYTVTVTDANGCTTTASYTVTQPAAALAATVTPGTITCYGGTTSIVVSATGGTAPYTGTGTFTVIAGTFNYTVTDANGCSSSVTIMITQPTQLNATVTSTNAACAGNFNSATIIISSPTGGSGLYEYSINAGSTWQSTGTYNVNAGTYNVQIRDANNIGCVRVLNPALVITEAANTDVSIGSIASDNLFSAVGEEKTIMYNLSELNGKAATPSVLRIFKPSGYQVLFNSTLTTYTDLSALPTPVTYTLDNSNWQLTTTTSSYVEYSRTGNAANNTIGCNQQYRVAFSLKRTTVNISKFNLNTQFRPATGEIKLNNNTNSIIFTGE